MNGSMNFPVEVKVVKITRKHVTLSFKLPEQPDAFDTIELRPHDIARLAIHYDIKDPS